MIRFFLKHPTGVILSFLGLAIFSLVAFRSIPVSLLPPVEIPRINVYFIYSNASPQQVESQVLEKARSRLVTLSHLHDFRTIAENGMGRAELLYEYGTDMKLAYIEVNEQLDRMAEILPQDLARPLVSRTTTSDIPIVRLQVIPKDTFDYVVLSEVTEKVIKRRLEQLEGVSLVDINGLRQKSIFIEPKTEVLRAYSSTPSAISKAVRDYNQPLGAISVKDGIYRYYLKIEATLQGLEDIANIPVWLPGGIHLPLKQLADVKPGVAEPTGYHLFSGNQGFVITIHKQESANMFSVMDAIKQALPQLQNDFPLLEFSFTQDQSALLEASMGNLTTSLIYGGLFAFLVLFLFMGNFRIPLIMGLSIPVSLVLSLLFFYLLDISINIISLSGLALGIGMLVDNAIVILDNISRTTSNTGVPATSPPGASPEHIAAATGEMFAPLLSSALTTLAVFVPLVFLSGITGALFYDQAVSITIILAVSLFVSFILLPVLYQALLSQGTLLNSGSSVFSQVTKLYEMVFSTVVRRPWLIISLTTLLLATGLWVALAAPKAGLPPVVQDDFLLSIEWNEPITPVANRDRCISISNLLNSYGNTEVETGISTFLLKKDRESANTALVYFKNNGRSSMGEIIAATAGWFRGHYPLATINFQDAPNAFSKTFASEKKHWEIHVRDPLKESAIELVKLDSLEKILSQVIPVVKHGLSNETETSLEITIHYNRLFLYKIDPDVLIAELKRWLGTTPVTDIKNIGESIPVMYQGTGNDFDRLINSASVSNSDGIEYPLHLFIDVKKGTEYKAVYGGKAGVYHQFYTDDESLNPDEISRKLSEKIEKGSFIWDFDGKYLTTRKLLREILLIMAVSFLLLYFILAAQFESLWQAFLVIVTLPVGLAGSLLFLWIGGETINIMAGIGAVVMLGIMVNDAILKVDTINRLFRSSNPSTREEFTKILHQAGLIRLKPILMTTITTVLAVVPILFSTGLGADLQKPLVWALAGGLITGTFTALWLIPVLYYQVKFRLLSRRL